MRHLVGAALLLIAPEAVALTAREVIEQAQARNGFSTWHDRKSLVTLQGFDGEVSRVMREAQVYERTDPRGEHRTLMEFLSPDDFKGIRYLHVSPRRTRQEWWMWTPAARRVRKLGGTYPGLQRDEIFFISDLSYSDLVVLTRIQQWTDAEGTVSLEGEETWGRRPATGSRSCLPRTTANFRAGVTGCGSRGTTACCGRPSYTTPRTGS